MDEDSRQISEKFRFLQVPGQDPSAGISGRLWRYRSAGGKRGADEARGIAPESPQHEIRQPSGAGVACHQPPIAAPIDRVPEDIFAYQQVDQK
jgi:hypothetical protein